MAKLPNPLGNLSGKPKTFSIPKPSWEKGKAGEAQAEAGKLLTDMGKKGPLAPKGKAPAPTPQGGFKPGMSGEQYAGEKLKDYAAMKPKLATKDKVLNPIKKAVGLPGKPAKLVPRKPAK